MFPVPQQQEKKFPMPQPISPSPGTLQAMTQPLLEKQIISLSSVQNSARSNDRLLQPVAAVTSDSRSMQKNSIFVALSGSHVDGHQYVETAIQQQALAIVIDTRRQADFEPLMRQYTETVFYVTPEPYKALAALSSQFFQNPGQQLRMIGVTGTNGKTTVTHLVEQLLLSQRYRVGLIGTLGHKSAMPQSAACQPGSQGMPSVSSGSNSEDSAENASSAGAYQNTSHTTPMAPQLQAILHDMAVTDENEFVVMEVSSHALEQHRVYGCNFEVAVLTNVTQDHLDYHKTMDQYWKAKALLFQNLEPNQGEKPKTAVINLDSDYAAEFVAACPEGVRVITYSISNPAATIRIRQPEYSIAGSRFTLVTPDQEVSVALKLGGQFSVYNALAAFSTGLALGIPLKDCIQAIGRVSGIRGRFELVSEKPYVLVDYAHTPDGLENVLRAARLVTPASARLIVVFGCGGDRDATKRPKMGHIAEMLADVLFITSDNPRTEDPQQIITDIMSGIERFDATSMVVEPDRLQAIHQAINLANAEDIVVIAGKGHEDYQILADRTIHFDDREVVQTYLEKTPGRF
jgi:UDP-N-acetylmuramoyl-L-alanyl-D-glutamate--2,6-diaminopimelate ligase